MMSTVGSHVSEPLADPLTDVLVFVEPLHSRVASNGQLTLGAHVSLTVTAVEQLSDSRAKSVFMYRFVPMSFLH